METKNNKAFTLIEILVVIAIIGILIGLSLFGLTGARESSRDAKRKADLELIRGAIETYRSDCSTYPLALTSPLVGTTVPPSACSTTNVYISALPVDPITDYSYRYFSDGIFYEICAYLETSKASTVTCGGASTCGPKPCNYKVTNP